MLGELRGRLKGRAERTASSEHIFSTVKIDHNKESEELFVESEAMEIYSQTGPTFPEFDRHRHPNIGSRHRFPTLMFLPIPITHIVQFELPRAVQTGNEVP
jgi:hypothetical protein